MLALSQVRMCRPLPTQFCSHFQERCVEYWIEWKLNIQIFIFWFMSDNIYNLPTKNIQIYRKDADCSVNYFLVHEFILCATFSLWDILDLDVFDLGIQKTE